MYFLMLTINLSKEPIKQEPTFNDPGSRCKFRQSTIGALDPVESKAQQTFL